jgi:hypothetical protein
VDCLNCNPIVTGWLLCPRSLATKAVPSLLSPGKPRPLRWPCGFPLKATSPGKGGRPCWSMNSSPRRIVATRTTVPTTTNTGWLAAARTSRDCETTLQSKRDACSQRRLGRRLSTYTARKTRRSAERIQLAVASARPHFRSCCVVLESALGPLRLACRIICAGWIVRAFLIQVRRKFRRR